MKLILSCPSIALFSTFLSSVIAQTSFLYKWRFEDISIQRDIPTCENLKIIVTSFDTETNLTKGSPPYYMMAMAIDGVPTTTLIGTSEDNLEYRVTHPVGTRLILSLTDSQGNPGGSFAVQTVIAGENSSCVIKPSGTQPFIFTSNITTEISTCDPLRLKMTGGTAPYTVTIVASNSPAITNVTLPNEHDIYTWVNRASAGGELAVGVSDSAGHWASGTTLLLTKGSTSDTCPINSSSGKSEDDNGTAGNTNDSSQPNPSGNNQSDDDKDNNSSNSPPNSNADQNASGVSQNDRNDKKPTTVIAVCVSVGGVLLIGMAVSLFLCLQKRRRIKELDDDNLIQFQGAGGPVVVNTMNGYQPQSYGR